MQNRSALFFIREAFPLFLAIFIDGMGLGLLFPILNTLLTSTHSGFFTHPVSSGMRDFFFGLMVSVFMLCWFFGAAYLGDLSDAIGRKKSLLICLLGASIGYAISAIGVLVHSFSLLLIGRMIAGFTAGSQPIAQAAIVDISTEDLKARNIGLILLAASLGFICGPLCGAFFSDHHLVAAFNYATPLWFAAGVSLLNALLIYLIFTETFTPRRAVHWRIHQAIEIFISAFRHPKVKYLSLQLFLMLLGWSSYYSFIAMYLGQRYHFNTSRTGVFMAVMAAGFGLGFGWLVNYLAHRFDLKKSVFWALLLGSVWAIITVLGKTALPAWLVTAPMGMSIAVAYSMMITLFSNQVDETQQGWVMGITGAISSLAFAITGITSSLLAQWHVSFTILFSGLLYLCAAFAMVKFKR